MGLPEDAANSMSPEASEPEHVAPPSDTVASPPDAPSALDDLERVREMLFGDQLRRHREELDAFQTAARSQIERLQTLLLATIEAADERWTHRANAIERSLGTQLAELHQRIESEVSHRVETSQGFEHQFGAMKNELAETVTELREAQRSYEGEVRTQLLSQGELLSKSIHRHHEQAMTAIAADAADLRQSKADRDTIAELFLSVAERLTLET